VVIRWETGPNVSVLYGRCLHRGALLSDGCVEGDNLVCGLHNWDYRYRIGVSEYHSTQRLERFTAWIDDGAVYVDADEISQWVRSNPQSYDRDAYQGTYQERIVPFISTSRSSFPTCRLEPSPRRPRLRSRGEPNGQERG